MYTAVCWLLASGWLTEGTEQPPAEVAVHGKNERKLKMGGSVEK